MDGLWALRRMDLMASLFDFDTNDLLIDPILQNT